MAIPRWEDTIPISNTVITDIPKYEETESAESGYIPKYEETEPLKSGLSDSFGAAVEPIKRTLGNLVNPLKRASTDIASNVPKAVYAGSRAIPSGFPVTQRTTEMAQNPNQLGQDIKAIPKQALDLGKGLYKTGKFADSFAVATVQTANPTIPWEQKKAYWDRVAKDGEEAPLDEFATVAEGLLFIYGTVKSMQAVPEIAKAMQEWGGNKLRMLTIKERGLSIQTDKEILENYKNLPDSMKVEAVRRNIRLRNILQKYQTPGEEGQTIAQTPPDVPTQKPIMTPKPTEQPLTTKVGEIVGYNAKDGLPIMKMPEPAPRIAPGAQIKPTVSETGLKAVGEIPPDLKEIIGTASIDGKDVSNYRGIQETPRGIKHIIYEPKINDDIWVSDENFNKEGIEKAKKSKMELFGKLDEDINTYSPDLGDQLISSKLSESDKTSASKISRPETGLEESPSTTLAGDEGSQKTTRESESLKSITPPKTSIIEKEPDVKENLIEEAKKYKTAEEFVSSKSPVYHGSNSDFNEFAIDKLGEATSAESAKKGFFFTNDKKVAEGYVLNSAMSRGGLLGKQMALRNEYINRAKSESKKILSTDDKYILLNKKLNDIKSARERYIGLMNKVSSGFISPEDAYVKLISKSPFISNNKEEILRNYKNIYNSKVIAKSGYNASHDSSFIAKQEYIDTENIIKELENNVYRGMERSLAKEHNSLAMDIENKQVKTVYLDIKNPLIKDYKGEEYRDEDYSSILDKALRNGNDGVILRNTFDAVGDNYTNPSHDIFVAFSPSQIKTKSQLTDIWNQAHIPKFKAEVKAKEPWQMTKNEYHDDGDIVDKFTATTDSWKNTIHGSKYFSVQAPTSKGKGSRVIKIRFSNHDSSGNFITPEHARSAGVNDPSEYIQLAPDVFYVKGNFEVMSDKLNKNFKYIKKLIENNPEVQNDLKEYADMGRYDTYGGTFHKNEVLKALSEGKTIPPEVLKDYPELKAEVKTFKTLGEKFKDQPKAGGMFHGNDKVKQYMDKKGLEFSGKPMEITRLTKPVSIKDIYGETHNLTKGEEFRAYELTNNQYLIQDGERFIATKGKAEDLKNQGIVLGKQPNFDDEFQGLEETVKGSITKELKNPKLTEKEVSEFRSLLDENDDLGFDTRAEAVSAIRQYNDWADRWDIQDKRLIELGNRDRAYYNEKKSIPTKFSQYTLPGGENYREVLIKAPVNIGELKNDRRRYGRSSIAYQEMTKELNDLKRGVTNKFKSSHWDEPNVLSHLRMNDRTTPQGDKVAFIEEIQSDWAREGREKGFRKEYTPKIENIIIENLQNKSKDLGKYDWTVLAKDNNGNIIGDFWAGNSKEPDLEIAKKRAFEYYKKNDIDSVPYHPALKNWTELTLKRALKEAVDSDAKYLSWISGEQTADRYDLAKQVDEVKLIPESNFADKSGKQWRLQAYKGDKTLISKAVDDSEIGDYIGKDKAKKILEMQADENGIKTLSGVDLKVGGEWASNLYNKQIPSILEKMTKRYGGKIVDLEMGTKQAERFIVKERRRGDRLMGWDIFDTKKDSIRDSLEFYDIAIENAKKLNKQLSDIELNKQQALKITPEIRAWVKGEAIQPMAGGKKHEFTSESGAIANPVEIAEKTKEYVDKKWLDLREGIEDDWVRVKKLVQEKGAKVDETNNPYEAEIRYWGRVGARVEEANDTIINIDKEIAKLESKYKNTEIIKDIDKYLISKHAPERNAIHGEKAAGITNEEASKNIKEIESKPYSKELQDVAKKVKELNDKTLDVLLEGEVISQKVYDDLRKKYPNHVPLNRIMDENDDFVEILTSRGFNVQGTGLKRAKGSEREVSDILGNVTANLKSAIAKSEKNIVDNHTLKFARDNDYFDGLFEEIKPKAIGKTFGGEIIKERLNDPKILPLREKGEQVYLKINDPLIASALRGVNRHKVEGLLKGVAVFTRFYSGLMTRFNPEFFLSNKVRDLQETMVYLSSKNELGTIDAFKTALRDPASIKDVFNAIRGKNTEGAKLYKQMQMDGGTTGGLGLSTKEQVEIDLESIRKLNRSWPRMAAEKSIKVIDNLNKIFEDSTRLSVYKTALDNGVTRKKAAVFAKEASLNFNKLGTASPVLNSLYMFTNASVQGSAKMLRGLRNPKTAGAVILTLGSSILLVNEYNDNVDENWRDKVSKWDKLNGINIMIPTDKGAKYITIPISWGLKPIKVGLEAFINHAQGNKADIKEAFGDVLTSLIEGYNPVGGTDIISAAIPTIFDLPIDIARNKSWTGGKIRPDWNQSAPDSIKYFDSLREKAVGKKLIEVTRELGENGIEISPANMDYAIKQLVGGTGRFVEKLIETGSAVKKGKVETKNIPFVSRFYRDIPEDKIREQSKEFESLKEILKKQDKERFYFKQEAELAYEGMKNIPQKDANKHYEDIRKNNPELAKKIKAIKEMEDLKLTYPDRLIKQLGVENGQRADYVWKKLKEIKTNREKNKYIEDLKTKKIITDEVWKQLKNKINSYENLGEKVSK